MKLAIFICLKIPFFKFLISLSMKFLWTADFGCLVRTENICRNCYPIEFTLNLFKRSLLLLPESLGI